MTVYLVPYNLIKVNEKNTNCNQTKPLSDSQKGKNFSTSLVPWAPSAVAGIVRCHWHSSKDHLVRQYVYNASIVYQRMIKMYIVAKMLIAYSRKWQQSSMEFVLAVIKILMMILRKILMRKIWWKSFWINSLPPSLQ